MMGRAKWKYPALPRHSRARKENQADYQLPPAEGTVTASVVWMADPDHQGQPSPWPFHVQSASESVEPRLECFATGSRRRIFECRNILTTIAPTASTVGLSTCASDTAYCGTASDTTGAR
jgi:hypothetical protein